MRLVELKSCGIQLGGKSSKDFETALNLPDFEVLFGKYSHLGNDTRWSKLVDAEALLQEGERVIWLDDHIVRDSETAEVLDNENLFWIAPGPSDFVGLTPNHLSIINKVLTLWGR